MDRHVLKSYKAGSTSFVAAGVVHVPSQQRHSLHTTHAPTAAVSRETCFAQGHHTYPRYIQLRQVSSASLKAAAAANSSRTQAASAATRRANHHANGDACCKHSPAAAKARCSCALPGLQRGSMKRHATQLCMSQSPHVSRGVTSTPTVNKIQGQGHSP